MSSIDVIAEIERELRRLPEQIPRIDPCDGSLISMLLFAGFLIENQVREPNAQENTMTFAQQIKLIEE